MNTDIIHLNGYSTNLPELKGGNNMADGKQPILIEVLNGTSPGGGGCSCCASAGHCGTTPEEEIREMTDRLSDELLQSFGYKVEVKLINADAVGLSQYPLVSKVLQMGYPYPITLINGKPKFAGGIMTDDIIASIESILVD